MAFRQIKAIIIWVFITSVVLPLSRSKPHPKDQVAMGRNRMELPRGEAKMIGPNGVLGIYLCFSEGIWE